MSQSNQDQGLNDLARRLLAFAVAVVKLVDRLPNTRAGNHIGRQLLASGTSPGANYEEASGAKSSRDFVHKLQIVLKELRESRYWLRVIETACLLPVDEVRELCLEAHELVLIFSKSVVTAKANRSQQQ